jgi:predicted permease
VGNLDFPLGDLARDLRYGARTLKADPRFTIVALLTLVLTVASVTTIFALVYSVLLRPLPYPDDDRLVIVGSVQPNGFGAFVEFGDFEVFREQARSFEAWSVYPRGFGETILEGSSDPLPVQDLRVTPELFAMLGIDAALGRTLQPSDADPSAPNAVVISHEVWQRVFAGDPGVLGRTLTLRSGTYSIVGVAPPGADVPANWMSTPIIWRPVGTGPGPPAFTALARLRSGVSIDAGRAELVALAAGLAAARPDTHEGRTATVKFLRDEIVGNVRRLLWIFFGAVSCVLLIGIANLTMLQLARNAARGREVAVRAALGAARARIVRERVVESLLLSGVGGALGLAVALLAVRLVVTALPARFPLLEEIGVDATVAAFALVVAVLVGVAVGGLPAWHASDPRLTRWLSESGRTATVGGGRSRTQRALVTVQTAVALVLLIGAGLLASSLYHLISRDAGMREEGLSVATARLPSRYRDEAAENAFWASALEQVRAIPGVHSAALASGTPLSGNDAFTRVVPEGVVAQSPRDGLQVSYRDVSDEYFTTLGIPLSRGRGILLSDAAGAESVVVVNELAAAQLWPGEDPLGKRLGEPGGEMMTVVGVVPTFRHTRLDRDFAPQVYVPRLQGPSFVRGAIMLFRAEPGDRRAAAAVRSTLTALESELEPTVTTMADVRWRLVQPERFRTGVLLAFAGAAVLLALVGIVGVVAYTVGQRHREIAVRVALGAVPRDILGLTSRQAIVPALWGLALGLGGAMLTTRLLSSYLVDVGALDLPTFAAAVAALALFAAVAAVMTARRALVVDPVEALRAE